MMLRYSHSELTEATYDTKWRRSVARPIAASDFIKKIDASTLGDELNRLNFYPEKLGDVMCSVYQGQVCYYFNVAGTDRVFIEKDIEPKGQLYLLNSPVLTSYGEYRYEKIEQAKATALLSKGFISAVGHASTAEFIEAILDLPIPHQRQSLSLDVMDKAVVFTLEARLSEGRILTSEELANHAYSFSLLTRLA